LGLIVFFFLILSLTNSKSVALLSSGLLAIIPPYLYRTMAGFADHEAIGMFAFFSVLLFSSLNFKYLSSKFISPIYLANLIDAFSAFFQSVYNFLRSS